MSSILSLKKPLSNIFLWKKLDSYNAFLQIWLTICASLLIAIASQLQIPLEPVPVTLQNLAVLLVGMTLGWRLGGLSLLLYLVEGAIGAPFFAKHLGIIEFFSPSAGYLLGFLPATMISGYLVEKGWGRNMVTTLLAALAGMVTIYGLGVPVLASFVGIKHAIQLGVLPFIPGEIFKLAILALVIPAFWHSQDKKI